MSDNHIPHEILFSIAISVNEKFIIKINYKINFAYYKHEYTYIRIAKSINGRLFMFRNAW